MGFEHIDHVLRDSIMSSPPHGSKAFPPGAWALDPATSVMEIMTRTFGFHRVTIVFKVHEGMAEVDDAGAVQRLHVSLFSESADSNNSLRDRHLRGPRYLDAAHFPRVDFNGRAIGNIIDGVIELKGHKAPLQCKATEASLLPDGAARIAAHGLIDRRLIGLGNKTIWCIAHDVEVRLKGIAYPA